MKKNKQRRAPEQNPMLRLAEIIDARAVECGKSAHSNQYPYPQCFTVVGIVLSDLADKIRADNK